MASSGHLTGRVQIRPWIEFLICIERTHRVQVGLMRKDAHLSIVG